MASDQSQEAIASLTQQLSATDISDVGEPGLQEEFEEFEDSFGLFDDCLLGAIYPADLYRWEELYLGNVIQPKPFQIRTTNAFLKGLDTILCAPTGTGKGVIFDMIRKANPEGIYVVILPLKALEEEMTDRIGPSATYVNEDHDDAALLKEIQECKYRMIFVSVEMANSKRIKDIMRSAPFRNRVAGLIIDEAHTIKDWGVKGFREQYRDLGQLKLSLDVPALAMSATLTKAHLDDLRHVLEMPDPTEINMGSDRPNINLRVLPLRYSMGSLRDLLYAMPELVPYADTNKPIMDPEKKAEFAAAFETTYIYSSTKGGITDMMEIISKWFENAGFNGAVATYCADDSVKGKRQVVEDVRSRKVLCVICTDALGMGSDVKIVTRVVQWKLDRRTTIVSFWQRVGRAGRDYSTLATGFLFVDANLLSGTVKAVLRRTKQLPSVANPILPADRRIKETKDEINARKEVDPALLALVDETLTFRRCPRKIVLSHLNQPHANSIDAPGLLYTSATSVAERKLPLPCCDGCHSILLDSRLREPEASRFPRPSNDVKERMPALRNRLMAWRRTMWVGLWRSSGRGGLNFFLSVAIVEDIVSALGVLEKTLHIEKPKFELTKFYRGHLPEDVAVALLREMKTAIVDPKAEKKALKRKRTEENHEARPDARTEQVREDAKVRRDQEGPKLTSKGLPVSPSNIECQCTR